MQVAAVIALLAVCGYFVLRKMAKDLGIMGRGEGANCGCGSCASKKKKNREKGIA